MAFNTSTRKEDISVKYRAMNFQKARDETKALESESRKMEERLQELKMVMTREKEEREQAQGGAIWGAGREGALGAGYTTAVLKKPKPKGDKVRKVKILKEEPIVPVTRAKGPGTMGHIARGKNSGKENKIHGPRCGQCEEKGAQVSCLECGEDYCAGCFAAFHLRGNLKKHRSVPVGSKGSRTPRGNTTPRNMKSSRSPTSSSGNQMAPLSENTAYSPDKKPDSLAHNGRGLSPGGDYDEAESAASFQEALRAWRGEESSAPVQKSRPRVKPVSPVRSPIVSIEHGTSTSSDLGGKTPDIKFHSSLTYAEKLLLKAHRRSDVGPLTEDHRSNSENMIRNMEYSPIEQPRSSRSERQVRNAPEETLVEVLREPLEEPDDGITWRDLHHAMKSDSIIMDDPRSESRVSIIELEDDLPVKSRRRGRGSGVEQTSKYEVSEVGRDEDIQVLTARKQSARGATKNRRADPATSAKARTKPVLPSSARTVTPPSRDEHIPKQSARAKSKKEPATKPDLSLDLGDKGQGQISRPKSSARPRSTRPKSSRAGQARPQSRAMSRAETRLALFGEGELTKTPSDALKEVARMTPRSDHTSFMPTMGEFFTFGAVTQEEVKDRVMTPTKNKVKSDPKDAGIPKWKVSYNLYNIGPRSWKPEKSLKDQADDNEAVKVIDEASDRLHEFLEPDSGDKKLETVSYSITDGLTRTESTFVESSRTPKLQSSRGTPLNSARNKSHRENPSPRPESRAIVVDGDDLSSYDFDHDDSHNRNEEDEDALHQLEWELASHDGRITEDGVMSRMSIMITPEQGNDRDKSQEGLEHYTDSDLTPRNSDTDPGIVQASLDTRMNNLMDDFEEMEEKLLDAEEVKALH